MRFSTRKTCVRRAGFAAVLLAWAAAAAAVTSYKQPGFSESAVFTGLTNPTVVRFLPDGRVLVAEKSGLIKLFPNLTTNTYTVVADLRTEVYNLWDRGLLGLAIDPELRDEQLHLRPLLLRRHDRRHAAQVGRGRPDVRPLSDAARRDDRRLRDQQPPHAPDGHRRGLDGQRDAAAQRLVPAVPEPLDRRARFRRGRLPLRQRRRRRQLQQRRLGPVRRRRGQSDSRQPLRRPALSRRHAADQAHRRGRRAAQPESAPAGRRAAPA